MSQIEPLFISNRRIFIREASSRIYSPYVFAIAQTISEIPGSIGKCFSFFYSRVLRILCSLWDYILGTHGVPPGLWKGCVLTLTIPPPRLHLPRRGGNQRHWFPTLDHTNYDALRSELRSITRRHQPKCAGCCIIQSIHDACPHDVLRCNNTACEQLVLVDLAVSTRAVHP